MITKTVAVLKCRELGYHAFSNFITFEYAADNTGVIERTVVLSRKLVDDLEWPTEITVTIEPGDTLNSEGE